MRYMLIVILLVPMLTGCGPFNFRRAATEPQKQAAELAVRDIKTLQGHVEATHEPIRVQALAAAEVALLDTGMPAIPAPAEKADAAIAQAKVDASQPPPTWGTAVGEATKEATGLSDDLATILSTLGFTGAAGLIFGVGKIIRGRGKVIQEQTDAVAQRDAAVRELVSTIKIGIDQGKEAMEKLLAKQTKPTQELVASALVENRNTPPVS